MNQIIASQTRPSGTPVAGKWSQRVALGMFLIGVGLTWAQYQYNANHQQAVADQAAESIVETLTSQLDRYELGLKGARGAIQAIGEAQLSPSAFKRYIESRDHQREFPGALATGFVTRVAPEAVQAFETQARQSGLVGFEIYQINPSDAERWVTLYVESQGGNTDALGLDIGSEPSRREAAVAAAQKGSAVLSAPIKLVQEEGDLAQSFLLFLPVTPVAAKGLPSDLRLNATQSWVYFALNIRDMLNRDRLLAREFELAITDITGKAAGEASSKPFFTTADFANRVDARYRRSAELNVYGRVWRIDMRSMPSFGVNQPMTSPWLVAFISALAGLVAVWVTGLLAGQRDNKRLQQAQEDASRRLVELAVDAAPNAMIMVDSRQRITMVNHRTSVIFGHTRDELIGQPLTLLIPERYRAAHPTKVSNYQGKPAVRAMGGGLPLNGLHRDGHEFPVEIGLNPIGAGDDLMVLASVVDLSSRQALETQLRAASYRAKLAVDAAGLGVWDWDLASDELTWDERMCALFEVPADVQATKRYREFWATKVHPDDRAQASALLASNLDGKGAYDTVYRIVLNDSSIRYIHARGSIESDANGKPIRMIGINRDVTDVHVAEAQSQLQRTELQAAKDAAEHASRAKSEFVANMSHEIRTPMNAILGLAYLLEKQALNPVAKGMVSKIHSAGKSLLGIINDILDFSKIEARHLEIENVPFRLSEVMDNLASVMSSALGRKGVELAVAAVPPECDHLRGDSLRLSQVLINLAGNAIKFTERGEVAVMVEPVESSQPERCAIRFSVRDTGVGIPAEKLDAIFQAFSQADSSTTRTFGGTGLGLSISRQLVELMGGQLSVQSEIGKGSEFSFILEFERSADEFNSTPELTHQRVLVTDDNETARQVIGDAVQSLGWYADTVPSGAAAVASVGESGDRYDVLIMDMVMPGMDGLQALSEIQKRVNPQPMPVVIMLTAYDRDRVTAREESGLVDVILPKPVTSSALFNAVLEAKSRRGQITTGDQADVIQTERLKGWRILVVDDTEMNREVAMEILKGEGAEVECAVDGEECLIALNARPQYFDLVLMDVQMPVLDGYGATKRIRETPALAHLKVIALTAGALQSQVKAATEAGMDSFVPKPFDVEVLVRAINDLLQRDTAPRTATAQDIGTALRPLIDQADALRKWRKPATWTKYLKNFTTDFKGSADEIRALMDRDALEAAKAVHKLRGAAGSLSLWRLMDGAALLETSLSTGAVDATEMDKQLKVLGHTLNQTLEAIEGVLVAAGAAVAPISTPESTETTDNPELKAVLQRLAAVLVERDPDLVEPLLTELTTHLSPSKHAQLTAALDEFDFSEAARLVERALSEFEGANE